MVYLTSLLLFTSHILLLSNARSNGQNANQISLIAFNNSKGLTHNSSFVLNDGQNVTVFEYTDDSSSDGSSSEETDSDNSDSDSDTDFEIAVNGDSDDEDDIVYDYLDELDGKNKTVKDETNEINEASDGDNLTGDENTNDDSDDDGNGESNDDGLDDSPDDDLEDSDDGYDFEGFVKVDRNFQTAPENVGTVQLNPWESIILGNKAEANSNNNHNNSTVIINQQEGDESDESEAGSYNSEEDEDFDYESDEEANHTDATISQSRVQVSFDFSSASDSTQILTYPREEQGLKDIYFTTESTTSSRMLVDDNDHITKKIDTTHIAESTSTTFPPEERTSHTIHKPPPSEVLSILPVGPPSSWVTSTSLPNISPPTPTSEVIKETDTTNKINQKIITKVLTTTVAITIRTTIVSSLLVHVPRKATTTTKYDQPTNVQTTGLIDASENSRSSGSTRSRAQTSVSKVFSSGMTNELNASQISSIIYPSQTGTTSVELPSSTEQFASDITSRRTTSEDQTMEPTPDYKSVDSTTANTEETEPDTEPETSSEKWHYETLIDETETEEEDTDINTDGEDYSDLTSTWNDEGTTSSFGIQVPDAYTGVVVPDRQFVLRSLSSVIKVSSTIGIAILFMLIFLII